MYPRKLKEDEQSFINEKQENKNDDNNNEIKNMLKNKIKQYY